MSRYIHLFILALLTFGTISCSEIYNPKVDSNEEFLVVDGLISNGDGPFVINLNKSMKYCSFYSTIPNPVSKAKVIISDNTKLYELTETSPGKYTTPSSFTSKIGNSYKLQIQTAEGDIYESDYQKLNQPAAYDSIKSYIVTGNFLDANKTLKTTTGADIRIDLSNASSAEQIKCRFTTNLTVQYEYTPQQEPGDIHIPEPIYGWITGLSLENNVNLTDESSSSLKNRIDNHKIGFIPFGLAAYQAEGKLSFVPVLNYLFYYLKINQYTLNDAAFAFYKAAKAQLSTSGKIFDPIATQLYSNIKCTNHPSKLALGFFEVSSITTAAIFIFEQSQKMVTAKVPYVDISPIVTKPVPYWWGHGVL